MTAGGAPLVIGLGANLGTDAAIVARFVDVVAALAARGPTRTSRVYRSAALTAGDPDFLNAAVALTPTAPWSPLAVLAALHALEAGHGRVRAGARRWGPRPLDLDVLVWGDLELALPTLVVPHPRVHERSFALAPLIDLLGPDWVLPGRGVALGALAEVAGPPLAVTAYVLGAS